MGAVFYSNAILAVPQRCKVHHQPLPEKSLAKVLTPEMLLSGYAQGVFPMALSRNDQALHWFRPQDRGIIPLDGFHISRSLARTIRREIFEIRINTAFNAVVDGCSDRDETWINGALRDLYRHLFTIGHAHSLEVWKDGKLGGGIFAVTIGGAFFGESM